MWPMIIAAGASLASGAIKAAQAKRAKGLRDDPRGQANSAFGANYNKSFGQAQQATEDAAMHQQLSVAKSGSGTLGSQAASIQMANQRAPAAAAQAQLAAGRVAEGFAGGANQYMGTTMAGDSAGMDAQAFAENQMIDAMGIGAQTLAGAFGGGGAPIESDARSKQQIQALTSQNNQLRELEMVRQDQLRRLGALGGQSSGPQTQAPNTLAYRPNGNYVAQADFGGIQKPATSTPSWLSPNGGMQVTTQEEGALGSVQEMAPPNGATRSYSYSVEQAGNQGSAFGASGDREMQARPAGLPAHNPNPRAQAPNRPAGALRHQVPTGGVDMRNFSPEARALFALQNPDHVDADGSGVFTREGAPGTGGMGGPPGGQAAPDQLYFDQSGQFNGEFAPWVQDKHAARDLSTGGALRDRPVNYHDQPNAYSDRIKFDAGGFKQGQGYTSSFQAPESYRQMVKDGKITGMVRVPILDFTNKVGLQRPPGGASGAPQSGRPSAEAPLKSPDTRSTVEADNVAAGKAHSDSMRQELAFREEMRAKNAAAGINAAPSGAARPRAPGGAPALANVPQKPRVIAEEPFVPSTRQRVRQEARVISEEPFVRAPQIKIGSAQMEPEPQIRFGEAQIEPALEGQVSEPEAPAEAFSQDEMRDYVMNEFMALNPGYYGRSGKVRYEDLDEATAKKVDAKTNEFMRKQEEALASEPVTKPVSDKRAKRKSGRVSAAEVFEKTPGYSYEYRPGTEGSKVRPGTRVGIMAQDLEKTPAGKTVVETGPDGKKRVDAAGLTLIHSAALNEIQKRLKKMEARVG